jgi:predicted nucleic acid-binding protein
LTAAYLDSSAIVKLIVVEPESAGLRRFLRRYPVRSSSALARVEVIRAALGQGDTAVARAREVVKRIDLIAVDEEVLERAAGIDPPTVRSLDAIHLASAMSLRDDLSVIVTYDERQIEGARAHGIRVESPR